MGLLDGLFDSEGMVSNTIENCLERVAYEENCRPTEIFIMIKATTDNFEETQLDAKNFRNWIYKMEDGKPKLIREITLKEILSD